MAAKLVMVLGASLLLISKTSGQEATITLTADPKAICVPVDIPELSLTCKLVLPDEAKYNAIKLAILKEGELIASILATGDKMAKLLKPMAGVEIDGKLGKPESNLTLKWQSPTDSVVGNYLCDSSYLQTDVAVTVQDNEEIIQDNTDRCVNTTSACPPQTDRCFNTTSACPQQCLDQFQEVQKNLTDRINRLENELVKKTTTMSTNSPKVSKEDQSWKDVVFNKSPLRNNKRYYLSRFQPTDVDNAQSACESLGGYLAEIDDNSEYNFIRNFVNNRTGPIIPSVSILLGGTDESSEGTWVYRRTGNPIGFRDWAPGQPDNMNYAGVTESCQSLIAQDSSRFQMNDMPRWITNGRSFHFLCEVPEDG